MATLDANLPLEHKSPKFRTSQGKLKAACDACCSAKVKCDQKHPACQRCVNARRPCNYSVSHRTGRRPGFTRDTYCHARRKALHTSPPSPKPSIAVSPKRELDETPLHDLAVTEDVRAEPLNADLESFNPELYTLHEPWHEPISGVCGQGNEDSFMDPFVMPNLPRPAETRPGEHIGTSDAWALTRQWLESIEVQPLEPPTDISDSGINTPSPFNEMLGNTATLDCPHMFTESFGSSPDSETRWRVTCNRTRSCRALAATILHSFQSRNLPSNFDTSLNPEVTEQDGPLPMDQALTANRQAISTLYTILQCPCSSSSVLSLTVANIILHILSDYKAAARALSRTTYPPPLISTSSGLSSEEWGGSDLVIAQGMHVNVPITMGTYQMDAEDEHNVKLQLILYQLEKVSKLINVFTGRYCSGTTESEAADENVDKSLHCALQDLLIKECRDVVNEVARLRMGS